MGQERRQISKAHAHEKRVKLTIEDTAVTRPGLAANKEAFPYHGASGQKPSSRKKDLRKLGEWIKAKRKADELAARRKKAPQ
jgi:hypothetical protein